MFFLSKTICCCCHQLRGGLHELFQCFRQLRSTGRNSVLTVLGFLVTHGRDNRATPGVLGGKFVEVSFKVIADLTFGFSNEAKTPFIAQGTADSADRECARIPDRAESTRLLAQFLKSLFAPGQMIEFLVSGLLHLLLYIAITRNNRVALIEALGCDLAGMIDAHQASGMGLLLLVQVRLIDIRRRIASR